MRSFSWLRPAGWLGMLGTVLFSFALVQAQQPEGTNAAGEFEIQIQADEQAPADAPQGDVQFFFEGEAHEPLPMSDYWIGLACDASALNATVRAQLGLPEDQGLAVASVVPDSPAAAAGFKDHDILLSAGDKPLAGVADLVRAVDEAKEQEMSIELMREGKKLTIVVTPAKRPEGMRPDAAAGPDEDFVQRWIARLPGGGHRMRLVVPQQGVLLPHVAGQFGFAHDAPPLPEGTTVAITKTGGEPAKIVVERGEERFEVTADKIDELPEDLRGPVGAMIGRMPFGIHVQQLQPPVAIPAPEPGRQPHIIVRPVPPQPGQVFADPFAEILKRLDELQKAVAELQAARQTEPQEEPQEPQP